MIPINLLRAGPSHKGFELDGRTHSGCKIVRGILNRTKLYKTSIGITIAIGSLCTTPQSKRFCVPDLRSASDRHRHSMNPTIVLRSIASTNKTLLGLCLTPFTTECAIIRGTDGSSFEMVSSGSMLKAEELGALCVRHEVRVEGLHWV